MKDFGQTYSKHRPAYWEKHEEIDLLPSLRRRLNLSNEMVVGGSSVKHCGS